MHRSILTLFLAFVLPLVSDADEITLRVLTFNIWYGGEQVSFSQTVRELELADADIIGIQEPDGNLRKLAQAAGYSYVDEKRNIISRYPLFDPDTDVKQYLYTRVLVRPGKIVAVANTHLPSTPYGPDLLRDGKSLQEVLEVEKQLRVPELTPYIEGCKEALHQGYPVFFTGDFNSPSHLDWTTTAGKQNVQWPVTKALADAGLRDSYREVHPDVVQHPGVTFTPGYPHPWVKASEVLDRIDMIWSAGKTKAVESRILGEAGNRWVDVIVDPYPSDHRAVLSTFRVEPADAPAMIATDQRIIEEGSDLLVRFQTPGNADWGVALVAHGKPPGEALLSAKGPNLLSTRPTFKFGTRGIVPGEMDAVLIDAGGKELARTIFYIKGRQDVPVLTAEKPEYKSGEAITVSWRNAPGMKNDWIGVYKANDTDLYGGYIGFVYTGARVAGTAVIESRALAQPLSPGDYTLRLMRDDSYVTLASTTIRVE